MEHLRKEQVDAQKVLAASNQRIKQQQADHKSQLSDMQLQIDQANDDTNNVQEELRAKMITAEKVRNGI